MKQKTCGDCIFYHGIYDDCGVCTLCETDETFDKTCDFVYSCEKFQPNRPTTNGDRIRQMSDAELAEKFVFDCGDKDGDGYRVWYSSITEMYYFDEPEAIAATVARLKEVAE